MTEDHRSIELEVEVPGTPEEVWRAVATGPGISSWYVPHVVEEREGGAAVASFGPGPQMQVPGRVAAWEPPRRVVFDGGRDVDGMAFEWLVEARDGGTCVVRLINSGFGTGEEWDAQYDGMTEGWQLFLLNLRLHLQHFGGRTAAAMLPMANWAGPRPRAWTRLLGELGLPSRSAAGERVEICTADAPPLAGTVADAAAHRLALVLHEPAPGTAFVVAEGEGETVTVSIWAYFYGDDASAVAERDRVRWQAWLDQRSTPAE